MKKFALGIAAVIVVALMIYLTKPNQAPTVQTTNPAISQVEESPVIVPSKEPQLATIAKETSCNSKDLNKQLEQLKKERNDAVKSFAEKETDKEMLSQVVISQLQDHSLAQIIDPPKQAKHNSPNSSLFNQDSGSKLLEELMMASMAGQTEEYIEKFKAGDLSPLDPNKAEHKNLIIQIMAFSGDKGTLSAINGLYQENSSLPIEILPAVFSSIKDREQLQPLLQKVEDLNEVIQNSGARLFAQQGNGDLLSSAIQNQNYKAASLLLDMGAKPNLSNNSKSKALDHIYDLKNIPTDLLTRMLDKGYTNSNVTSSNRMARELKDINPTLAAKFTDQSSRLMEYDKQQFMQMPQELQDIINQYKTEQPLLHTAYINCITQESKAKPKIPPYQPIDRKKIEAEIDQMIAQKVQYEQIIITLSARNKETVEHGYKHLQRLRSQKLQGRFKNMSDMPPEFKTMIGYYKDGEWDKMVELMKNTTFDPALEFSPATMIPEMIEKGAPESAIAAMAEISDKNDVKLLRRAQFNPTLLDKIAGYGFNLDAKDNSNKNLFYQTVKRGQTKDLDKIIGYGITMTSDPYGYDPLDYVLRKKRDNKELLVKLGQLGFPITDHHHNYSLYLKTYYPKRYEILVESIPNLKAEGEWEPKTL